MNTLGLIDPSDAHQLQALRVAIEFLCKETTQIIISPPPPAVGCKNSRTPRKGIRNLRKGIMPKGINYLNSRLLNDNAIADLDRALRKK